VVQGVALALCTTVLQQFVSGGFGREIGRSPDLFRSEKMGSRDAYNRVLQEEGREEEASHA